MSQDPRHALSHALVAGTTIWCIYNTHRAGSYEWQWIYGTYAPLCAYSLLGIWKYGNPEYGDSVSDMYAEAAKFVMCFSLPCVITELYLHYGFELQYAVIHAAIPIIPITLDIAKSDWQENLVDLIVLLNVVSGTIMSIMHENYYGLTASVSYLCNHFYLRTRSIAEVPTKIMYNAGLSFFLFYSYAAVRDATVL